MKKFIIVWLFISISSVCNNIIASTLTVNDFKHRQVVRDMELSPNGRHLATLRNKDGARVVVIQDIFDNAKVIATFGSQIVRPYSINWANDEKLLVSINVPVFREQVARQLKKKPISEIDYASVNRMVAVTPGKDGYVELLKDEVELRLNRNLADIHNMLLDKKDEVQFSAYAEPVRALYNANIYTGESELYVKGGRRTYAFASDQNGRLLYRFDYLPQTKAVQIYDFTGDQKWEKRETIYYDRDDETSESQFNLEQYTGILPDGTLIYRKLNEDSGFYELYSRDRNGNTALFVSHPNKDIEGLAHKLHTDEVIGYYVEEEDVIRTVYLDENMKSEYALIRDKLKALGVSGFHIRIRNDDANIFVITTNGMDDPRSYFIYLRKEKNLIFHSFQNPRLAPEKLAIPAFTNYKTRDGATIRSLMLLPNEYKQGEKYPLVVMPHGGPQARDYASFDRFAQFLATRGYIVMQPNFRGSTGYGREFQEAGYKEWGGLMQRDIEDAAKFAIRKGLAKPDKICIVGGSFGGYAALMGALNTEKLFQCAVSLNGVTHLPKIVKYAQKEYKEFPRTLNRLYERLGHPEKDKALLEAQSPSLRAKDVQIPILLVAGKEDRVVPFSQQKMMRKALKKAKKEFEYLELEETGHNPYRSNKNIGKVYPVVEAFLAEYLQD